MTEALRAMMHELHGDEVGQALYDAALANRAAALRISALTAELAEARRELGVEIQASSLHLGELQEAVNVAYFAWLDAGAVLEAQRIRHQQLKAQLRDLTRDIGLKMKDSAPVDRRGVNLQWHVPSWVRPESQTKGDHGPDSNGS